jgi:sodium/potassium-transporting ATPase subunit alpha
MSFLLLKKFQASRIKEFHFCLFEKKIGSASCTDDNYTESKNIAFMATMITNGTGKGIVIKTGANTTIGSIASLTSGAKEEKTTLQKEINNFVIVIAILAITTVTTCLIVWAVWIRETHPKFITTPMMVINAIAILTAFVPTGLPIAVTLSLLLVARKVHLSYINQIHFYF